MKTKSRLQHTADLHACKLCAALGAVLLFKGIKGAVSLLHGPQGCADAISQMLMEHFREPVDILSSEGLRCQGDLRAAIDLIYHRYKPKCIGIITPCTLSSGADINTTGPDESVISSRKKKQPILIQVDFSNDSGTHIEGFQAAMYAMIRDVTSQKRRPAPHLNLFPNIVSPVDLRYLQEILTDFRVRYVMLPDYSQTLDGTLWEKYENIPEGGTHLNEVANMGNALATVEFGRILAETESAGKFLQRQFDIPCHNIGLPIGIHETDIFFDVIQSLAGAEVPEKYRVERGRLISAYSDSYKHLFHARAIVYGMEDLVVGLASFLQEIGVIPIICASSDRSGYFREKIASIIPDFSEQHIEVIEESKLEDLTARARDVQPDLFIGNSYGAPLARKLKIPFIRVGFPIDDRMNGARISHLGYRGAQQLFDRITNALLESREYIPGLRIS